MRALCLSIVLVSAVSAVEKTDEQMTKTTGNQKEVGSETDSIKQNKLLVIGSVGKGFANPVASLKDPEHKICPENIYTLDNFPKKKCDWKFGEIRSDAIYGLNYAMLANIVMTFGGCDKDLVKELLERILTINRVEFSKSIKNIVGMLPEGGLLTMRLNGQSCMYIEDGHPETNFTLKFSGQYGFILAQCKDAESARKFFHGKADRSIIEKCLKGLKEDWLKGNAGLEPVLKKVTERIIAVLNSFNFDSSNMTVRDTFVNIVVPALQVVEYDDVLGTHGMQRIHYDKGIIPYGEKYGWYATYKKVGDPVTPDPTS